MSTDTSSTPLPKANIFLRPSDASRLERLVQAVADESASLALVSDSDALLDHYGRMLAEALRSSAKVAVEIYSPDSTDALMDRFNRILATMSVSEALKPQGSTAPSRLLLVYDGRATGIREMQLLARLLKDFPGANTRVALLLHDHAEATKKIEAFGKRMMRWDLQRPSPDEVQALIATSASQGLEPEARALLAYLGEQDEASRTLQETLKVLARADEALSSAVPSPAQAARAFEMAAPVSVAETPESTLSALTARGSKAERAEPVLQAAADSVPSMQVDPQVAAAALAAGAPRKRMPTILWVGLAALAASALLTVLQRLPDLTADKTPPPVAQSPAVDTTESSKPEDAKDTASAEPLKAEPSPEPSKEPSTEPAIEVGKGPLPSKGLVGPVPVPEDRDPAARLANSVAQAPAQSARPAPPPPPKPAAAPPAPAPAPVPAPVPAPAPVVPAAPAAPTPAPVVAPSTPPVPRAGNLPAEIKSIPAGFYVQHMSSTERAAVERFWRANPALRQARLVELTRIGAEGPNFVLLSGPFPTMNQARNFMNRPGLPRDMWVREASKIRPLLPSGG